MVEIVVPALGESVSEATVAQWLKKVGDHVARDEAVVELETDKVTLEVNAPAAGTLSEILVEVGGNVGVGAILGQVLADGGIVTTKPTVAAAAPAAGDGATAAPAVMPAARKLAADHGLDPSTVSGTGKDGRVTKADVQAVLDNGGAAPAQPAAPVAAAAPDSGAPAQAAIEIPAFQRPASTERPRKELEERVRMSKLRQTIATRLKQAQSTAAMLTTFNEVDMSALMAVRAEYKDTFEKRHHVRLGFMSFFVKACAAALQEFPAVNAEIDGTDIVYKNYYDIGVAVGTPQGLVVPVVRDCDRLRFDEIEGQIGDYGRRGRDGKLTMEELTGGTFTITNGGVFGSLMSTPILNPPQSAILGMHKVQDRPMVVGGQIVARPMMYLALSYDHRLVDGQQAVGFLVRVKELVEDPRRLLLAA